jgi:hypothetical protein
MHLRGPMNISQLAVYQVPVEAAKLRKRSHVPFYNRRRALQQDLRFPNTSSSRTADVRRWATATDCSPVSTITSSVTLTDCGTEPRRYSTAAPNTTYVGPPSQCTPGTNSSALDCLWQQPPTVTSKLERHPKSPLELALAPSQHTTDDTTRLHKRAADWDRVAYYTSTAPAQATGFSFLANLGDPGQSGTFD